MRLPVLGAIFATLLSSLTCQIQARTIDERITVAEGNVLLIDGWTTDTVRVHQRLVGPATIQVRYESYGPFYVSFEGDDGQLYTIQHYPPPRQNLCPQSDEELSARFATPQYRRVFAIPWVRAKLPNKSSTEANSIADLRAAYLTWEMRNRDVALAAQAYAYELYQKDRYDSLQVADAVAAFLRSQSDIVIDTRIDPALVQHNRVMIHVRWAGVGWEDLLVGTSYPPPTPIQPFTPQEALAELQMLRTVERMDTRVRLHLNYGNSGDLQTGSLAEDQILREAGR